MFLSSSPRFSWLVVSTASIVILVFGLFAWHSPQRLAIPTPHFNPPPPPPPPPPPSNGPADALAPVLDILRLLFDQDKIPVNQPEFVDEDGLKYELPDKPRYNKNLAKEVLVLDLETRQLASTDDFNNGVYSWRRSNHVTGGVFSHYLYALIHGYDYKFIQAKEFEDRHPTWIKPSALAKHIKDYKWVVFLDADATFRNLRLPLEWLLNYWNIEPHHSITMALDPWEPQEPQSNADRFNRTLTNTGFILVQNNENVLEILQTWHECPENKRYPNCSEWKQPRFHEQSAFGEYIRYDYEDSIKELPCAEANGFPGVSVSNCVGHFIRHYWFEKSLIKGILEVNIMEALSLRIQRIFAANAPQVIFQQENNEIR